MNTTQAALLLCLSLTVTYLIARNGRFNLPFVTVVGIVINTFTFFQYLLTQEPLLARAAVMGLQLSLIFTILIVGTAFIFRMLAMMEPSQQRTVTVSSVVELLFSL